MNNIDLGMNYFPQYNSDFHFEGVQRFQAFMIIRNQLLAEKDNGSNFYKKFEKSDSDKLKREFIDSFKAYYLNELERFKSYFSSVETSGKFRFADIGKAEDAVDFWFEMVDLNGFFDSLSKDGDSNTFISIVKDYSQSYSYQAAILRHLKRPNWYNKEFSDESLSLEYWRLDVDAFGDTAILIKQLYERAEIAALRSLKTQLMQQMRIDLIITDYSNPLCPRNIRIEDVFSNNFQGSLDELSLKLTSAQYELISLEGLKKNDKEIISRIGRNPSLNEIRKWIRLYFSTDHHLISDLLSSQVMVNRPDLVGIYINDMYEEMQGRI